MVETAAVDTPKRSLKVGFLLKCVIEYTVSWKSGSEIWISVRLMLMIGPELKYLSKK